MKKNAPRRRTSEEGIVLVATLMLLALLLAFMGVYHSVSSVELATVRYSKGTSSGFYSAEAGLNLRADEIRDIFVDFNRPAGVAPIENGETDPCDGTNVGSGDFGCQTFTFNKRDVKSYVTEDAANPMIITIPPGERYQNLNAQEYRYVSKSIATNPTGLTEAELELRFKSRLVPLFQFAAFYDKDLEILPGPLMTLSGPVHTNGDLYLYSNSATLTIAGQITTAGSLYRGRKDGSVTPSCNNNAVYVYDPTTARSLIPTCPSRTKVLANQITPWNGMIQLAVPKVTVPGPEVLDATAGSVYWDKADLRLALSLSATNTVNGIEVRNSDNTNNVAASTAINACAGTVASPTIYNHREARTIRLLDVDMLRLLNCLKTSNWYGTGKKLDDMTEGGLVFHFTVKGPDSTKTPFNTYGVRVKNGASLQSNVAGAPAVKGLTIVSDQPIYVMGNYNSTAKIPAAIMADAVHILSASWLDTYTAGSTRNVAAATTTINTAFLAGTDNTGGGNGSTYQNGAYNGGLENYPRFLENWAGRVLVYRGSFVSLGTPKHVNGAWGGAGVYGAPNRDWNYDTSFNNAANLPPITPRFVYLRQELFIRDFEKD